MDNESIHSKKISIHYKAQIIINTRSILRDEGYDAVIAEMAASKIAAAKDDDEKSSRRSSVASQVMIEWFLMMV